MKIKDNVSEIDILLLTIIDYIFFLFYLSIWKSQELINSSKEAVKSCKEVVLLMRVVLFIC